MTQEIAFDEPAGPIILGACVVSGRRDLPAGERLAARRDPALGHWLVTPSDRRRRSGERIFARKVRILTGSPSCPYRCVSPDRNVKSEDRSVGEGCGGTCRSRG